MRLLLICFMMAGISGFPGDIAVRADADPQRVREATAAGRIRPLQEVLETVRQQVPGKVLDVRVEDRSSPWTYVIKVRGEKGAVSLVTVNAETGRIMGVKGQR